MLGLKLNIVSKKGPWCRSCWNNGKLYGQQFFQYPNWYWHEVSILKTIQFIKLLKLFIHSCLDGAQVYVWRFTELKQYLPIWLISNPGLYSFGGQNVLSRNIANSKGHKIWFYSFSISLKFCQSLGITYGRRYTKIGTHFCSPLNKEKTSVGVRNKDQGSFISVDCHPKSEHCRSARDRI